MPGGTSSALLPSCFLSPRRRRCRSRSWTKVSHRTGTIPTYCSCECESSFFCADICSCGIPNQGTAPQHQEVHLPHEGGSPTSALSPRWRGRGEALCSRRRWTCMTIFRRVTIIFICKRKRVPLELKQMVCVCGSSRPRAGDH